MAYRQTYTSEYEIKQSQNDIRKSIRTLSNMSETEFQLGCDKIFASQWLNDEHVVLTTKDNKVSIYFKSVSSFFLQTTNIRTYIDYCVGYGNRSDV